MNDEYKSCKLCPRECKVNRNIATGFCGATAEVEINRIGLHFMEEPIISGKNGSGTIFFTHCTMNCVFCQNFEISRKNSTGKKISAKELADEYIKLQKSGAHNINLVSPTQYSPTIIESVKLAKENGLNIPVVYNTNGFEKPEIIKKLKGYIDIFLTDYKYNSPYLANIYSKCEDYSDNIIETIKTMIDVTGFPVFDNDGMLKKGTIIRHLMLPSQISDSIKIINNVEKHFNKSIIFSLMRQYTPIGENLPDELKRVVSNEEYNNAVTELEASNLLGYIQSDDSVGTDKIPNFNL